MSKKRKRISRRRLAGQRVLAHVVTHNLEMLGLVSVYLALLVLLQITKIRSLALMSKQL